MKHALVLFPLLILIVTGCRAPTYTHGIPNFAVVEPGIYRGGWPTMEGWGWLRDRGVSNLVQLDDWSERGDIWAWGGQTTTYLPIGCVDQTIGRPASNLLAKAVESIHKGTLVFCKHGQDRTGLVTALWRVRVCHWTREKAESEMMALGFHPWLRGLYWAWEEDAR